MLVVMKVLPLGVIDGRRKYFRVGETFGKSCVLKAVGRAGVAFVDPGFSLFGIRNKTDGDVGPGQNRCKRVLPQDGAFHSSHPLVRV
jgi:hypothetical protein